MTAQRFGKQIDGNVLPTGMGSRVNTAAGVEEQARCRRDPLKTGSYHALLLAIAVGVPVVLLDSFLGISRL
jgi:hypothetical protein